MYSKAERLYTLRWELEQELESQLHLFKAEELAKECSLYELRLDQVDTVSSRRATTIGVICAGWVFMNIERVLALAPDKTADRIRRLLSEIREVEKT